MRPLHVHCHLALGTLYAATGRLQQAHAALSAAITFYRAMDMIFWLPRAGATLVQAERFWPRGPGPHGAPPPLLHP
jgi:hypothetical protein